MKTIILLLIGFAFFVFFAYIIKALWKELKEGLKPSPSDDLYQLKWKIDYAELNEHSELYLIDEFKKLKLRKDIDQWQLNKLEISFKQRFQDLHQTDKNN